MERVIVLTNYEFSPTTTRVLFFLFGSGQLIQGLERLFESELTIGRVILAAILISTGLFLIFLGFALFSSKFSLTPKILISDHTIQIRENLFSRMKIVNWEDVKALTFKSFCIEVEEKNNSIKTLWLKTNAEVSIEIKKMLRELADKKSIPVTGG